VNFYLGNCELTVHATEFKLKMGAKTIFVCKANTFEFYYFLCRRYGGGMEIMMKQKTTSAWRQYEAGKDYKRRVGLYETNRRNERYYRGDQWYGSSGLDLPKPVFNIIRRITDYLVCTVASGNISVFYTNDDLPFAESTSLRELLREGTEILTQHAVYRWERDKLDSLMYRIMLDAALSGDGIIYCWWDPSIKTGQPFSGDIVTEAIDNTNLFVSDVNKADIQSQEYIILSGRDTVASLKREAKDNGVPASDIAKIFPDSDVSSGSGDFSEFELEDGESEKATYLIKFWRENGIVMCEKSTKECVIRRGSTGMRLYPVAYFNWSPTKNSFHGTPPVSSMIPNQKFINRAYALIMKHMTDTAFSKVIYDRSKIPEWSNEVGEAIAAVGGGNIADAVSVVGVGQMQDGYLDLIKNAIDVTKETNGATETALGNVDPSNTSAILALQDSARLSLTQVKSAFYRCIEDLASIWAEMIFCYYPEGRLLPIKYEGELKAKGIGFNRMKNSLIRSHIDVRNIKDSSNITTQSILDKLLEEGHIKADTYISLLPQSLIKEREKIMDSIKHDAERINDENGN